MSKWFPDVDSNEGVEKALKAGVIGALLMAALVGVGIAYVLATGQFPGTQGTHGASFVIGMAVELAIFLVTAWRFKIGKGLVWGAVSILIAAGETVAKLTTGHFAWFFFYAAIGTGLINGVRGAYARRTIPKMPGSSEVFE